MTNDPNYKSKLLQALYHKKISERNASLAEISYILENPTSGALEKLEEQVTTLTQCDLSIGQLELMYGPREETSEESETTD